MIYMEMFLRPGAIAIGAIFLALSVCIPRVLLKGFNQPFKFRACALPRGPTDIYMPELYIRRV